MAFEVKSFLAEAGFSEAEIAELEPKFAGERAKKLEGMALRQSDYSRQMNEVGKAKKDLEDANNRLSQELAEWATAKARDGEVSKRQQADLEKAQQAALRAEQVARRLAAESGLDPDKVLEGTQPVVTPKPQEQPNLDGYVKADQLGPTLRSMLHLPAVLMGLSNQHQQLFGQPLDTEALIAEVEKRAATPGNTKSTDPRAIWEEMHNVPQKRTEVEQARIDALVADAEKRGREAAASEFSVPGNTPRPIGRGPVSPVLHPGGKQRESVLQRGQPGGIQQKAVAALRSGKYSHLRDETGQTK